MTEGGKGNGATTQPAAPQELQVQVRAMGQYIKDMSFESPSIHKLMSTQADSPNLTLELNVHPERVGPDVYETTLEFKAKAESASIGVIFELEIDYSGLFKIENAPADMLDAMLHVQCPSLLFPFLRRIVADTTRDGGIMPPLMLDPVDFASLYMRKRASQGQQPAA